MAKNSGLEVIDEIKKYLYKYDYEKFYGTYRYNRKDYKASNLLYSLLLSERLGANFEYFEDIDLNQFRKKISHILLSKPRDETSNLKFIKFLKEINDITDQVVRMNGITFSYHEVLSNQVNFDDIKEDLDEKLNDDMRFSLDYINKAEKEVLNRFRKVDSPLTKLVDSKARGNGKQIGQEFLAIGYKVDNQSNILKKPILSSFMDGISTEEDFYIAAIGCRNAIIQGTNSVSGSGYLNRKLCFGTIDINLSETKDCGTTNYLQVDIDSKNIRSVLEGRYIVDDNGNLVLVDKRNIDSFLDKRVNLRSPITCCAKDGICKTCYGVLSKFNKGFSIGILAATSLAEIATQKLLSTKHLLNAIVKSDNPKIMEYIVIEHEKNTITCIKDFKVRIDNNFNKLFFILDNDLEIEFEHNFKNLKINSDSKDEIIEFKKGDIVFTNIQSYVNSDMNSLMKVLNRNFERTLFMKHVNEYNEYYKYMLEMLMSMGDLPSLHLEVIMSQMIKVKNNLHRLWRVHQEEEYQIVSIRTSNLSNSLFNNILFERVKESLLNLENYTDKDIQKTKYEQLFYNKEKEVEK